ncbi:MAG: CBS and ACT domain-containing protein [Desulfomonile sp.]|nr:CBS and ACT domain-containing protein [Desulfomonile sp.]
MLVKYWMRKSFVTVDENESMHEALSWMKEYGTSLLPVLKGGRLVGVVTDRDVKRASGSNATSLESHELNYLIAKIKVKDIMTSNPVTVAPDLTLEETAEILLRNEISGAPVVDAAGNVLGTISQWEIFRALISLSGLQKMGVHFAFLLKDQAGSIQEVTDIIRRYGGRLVSILSSFERAPSGYRHVYVRAYNIDRSTLPDLIADLCQTAMLLYMVDHRKGKRVEYIASNRVD